MGVFICRFVTPQNPPEALEYVEDIARYVSLIPKMGSMVTGIHHVWNTSAVMIKSTL
jgi:hypothetical protein